MGKLELTDTFIRHHPAPSGGSNPIEISDIKARGLVVRITPTGYKSFVYRYRFGKTVKRLTLGSFPELKLAKARDQAREMHLKVKQGIDPLNEIQERKKPDESITFRQTAKRYIEIHAKSLRENTRDEYQRIIDKELNPTLGDRPLMEITKGELIKLLDKKAIIDGKKAMANRIRSRLHGLFEFAISRDMAGITLNPVSSIQIYREGETKRERFYSEKEIQRLWKAFKQQGEPARSVLMMLLLTGQRSKETRHMKWSDIKLDQPYSIKRTQPDGTRYIESVKLNVWTIPAELAKGKRAHDVPLSDKALQIIEGLQEQSDGSEFVFNSPKLKDRPVGKLKGPVSDIKTSAKVKDFRLHDLRRTAATYMAQLSVDRTVLGKILNHRGLAGDGQVTAIYDRHDYMLEKHQALQRWADYLYRILDEQTGAKILKIG